jgi:hypothetical protein
MFASLVSDSGWVVAAVAGLVLAVAVLILIARRGLQAFTLKGPGVEARLEAVARDVRQINRAVNQVPSNTPPLIERVQVMERKQNYQLIALQAIAAHVGAELPEPPEDDT